MPLNTDLASKVWYRYQYARETGHTDFARKANICENYFRGEQWTPEDLAALKASRRPALTINKIISTIGNVMGEQIYNRSEISFRPKSGADSGTADILTKVFKQISDNNQLDWRRSDMFADGIITSRGFLDVRMDFGDAMQGEVRIENINPKNVLIDNDAEEHDPDSWNEVFVTKWMTADDIAVLYSKTDADLLRNRDGSYFPYGYDAIDTERDRFGNKVSLVGNAIQGHDMSPVLRNLRVIERQHRVLDRQKHFIDPKTGDMRPVPADWDRNRIALVSQQFGYEVIPKLVKRIRWTVISDNIVLHDDWSPYQHFTVVPYFPYFRRGKTVGLVENLLGPQELLNKVSSQELHVVNSSANSGYKVKTGALATMSIEELEQRGAETGLVIEMNGNLDEVEKIQPNATPQGLDRISYKAEEHIKTISGVSDSQQGMDREDVAAKAIQTKRQAASTNMAKPLDSLVRTDFMLARNILDLVQTFYTEERILTITHDRDGGGTEDITINQTSPEGYVLNDLTLGEFDVTISSVPQRETLEDSQFDQAVSMKKDLGIQIPDSFIIKASRLLNKNDLIKQLEASTNSPQAQAAAQLQQRGQEAEVGKTEAEIAQKQADAQLKQAKTQKEGVATQKDAQTPIETGEGGNEAEMMKVQAETQLAREKFQFEQQMQLKEFELKQQEMQQKQQLAQQAAAQKAVADRVARSQKPNPTQGA
ncbi:hypothetical protein [Herminiimonas sp. CN]|uniref:portal protein n=1 Tax=Herminiimonas sp. CN TaxID=1349818 RepID=UPI0004739EC6|nr:hypothetical protein [Herminiimonas sp. CN]